MAVTQITNEDIPQNPFRVPQEGIKFLLLLFVFRKRLMK